MVQVKVVKEDKRREVQVLKEAKIWADKCNPVVVKTASKEEHNSKIWEETTHKGVTKLRVTFKCMWEIWTLT